MARLLFRLNGVSEEEAEEVRALLAQHDIAYYETSAGRWRISLAALWLRDEAQWELASALLERYQAARQQRVRDEYAARRGRDEHDTLWRRALREPLRLVWYLLGILLVGYFSLMPFWDGLR